MHALAAFAAAVAVAVNPVGAYRFPDGSVAALVPQTGGLRYVDYASGALRQLRPAGRELVGGPGVSLPDPVSVRLRVNANGVVRDGQVGARIPVVDQRVRFRAGGIELAGRLLRPRGRGPFPAVVLVPGSVPARLDTYDLWAYFFVSQGYAVLSYDKRGVGGSQGSYDASADEANLRRLAADAVGSVEWLRSHRLVDPRRVGLAGGSQAGWTIVLAASMSPDVRFAAIQSGPAMSVARQLAYGELTEHGARDVTADEVAAALAGVPDGGYDPRPALASLSIPILWQLGALDKRMRTAETVANVAAVTGHDYTVRVYEGGAHSLRLTAHGLVSEERDSPGFAPAVFRDLAAWLRSHVAALP